MSAPALVLLLLAADPLTAERAVELAMQQSPELRALSQRQREEVARGAVATELENPELRLQSFRSDRLISPLFTGQPYSDWPLGGLQVGLRWSPPNPMLAGARGDEARHLAESAAAALEDQRRELAAKVRTLHATALNLDRQLQLSRTAVALRARLSELNRQRLAAQAARGIDQGLADLDELEARAQLLELEQRRRGAARDLAVSLGLRPGTALELAGEDRPCQLPREDAAALVARALDQDPRLRKRRAALEAIAAQRAQARLALVPWFSFVQLGYVLQNESTPAYASLRLGITLPLLDWNVHKVELLDARRDREGAEDEADRLSLARRVEEALDDVRQDAEVVARYREVAPRIVEESARQLQSALEAGGASLLDQAQAQVRSLGAQRAGLKAELHCQLSLIELDRLVGP